MLDPKKVLEQRDKFLAMYPTGIPYVVCYEKISSYLSNLSNYYAYEESLTEYLGFLYALKYIESTIKTYEEYHGGLHDYGRWLIRVVQFFFRANVEEIESINSPEGKALKLEFRDNPTNPNDRFHCGSGNSKADLYSPVNGEYYDVKHNNVAYDKIHEGHFIIKYQDDSDAAMLYDKNLAITLIDANNQPYLAGGYTGKTFTVTPLRQAFTNRTKIPSEVLYMRDEKQLEDYFGFIDLNI